MFSTNQINYIESFLPTYAQQDYTHYVAYTDSTNTSGYYQTEPDLYIIFAKSEITAVDGYTYTVPEGAVQLCIRTGNYSSSSSANNSDRVVVRDFTGTELSIDEYEHIYTNATFTGYTLQPDINLINGGETNVRIEAISYILLTVIAFVVLCKLWFRKRSRSI